MDFASSSQRFTSNNTVNSPELGYFPFHKTKILKSARKRMEESQENSFSNVISIEKDTNFSVNFPLVNNNNLQMISPTEKSLEITPPKDNTEKMASNFSEAFRSKTLEKNNENEDLPGKTPNLQEQVKKFKEKIQELQANEQKLKNYVSNLLDVNGKLTQKLNEKEAKENNNSNNVCYTQRVLTNNPNANNKSEKNIETLEKQLKDCTEERDYLQDKVISLNQKLESMTKKDAYKEKLIDFYQNRIKLYQFKLENYPKTDNQQIKCLEDYVMSLLGENSKLNKALEKSDNESKKWQEKYFDFEKAKELLVNYDSANNNQINNVAKITYNPNNIHDKEVNSNPNSEKKNHANNVWSCRPKNK